VVETLMGQGMRVACCARREDRLADLADRVSNADGDLLTATVDLRKERDILSFFERVRDTWGGVDVLINNAGLGHAMPLAEGETEKWREMLDVNVLALAVCTREVLRDLRRRKVSGHIIHISSMAAHRVPSGSGMYSATKYAVRALTEALRQELRAEGSKTRVTALSPGFVQTEFAEKFHDDPSAAAKAYDQFPVLTPKDIAEQVRFVLSQPAHVQIHDILTRPTEQGS
ncbi:MAG: SDR family NAD(P)-dependent oxidoreductase, partial [Myxococcales bacterium]|nr:SDR family NAD(P)-dependent oxidoreductase [Myxococcales bacterium]